MSNRGEVKLDLTPSSIGCHKNLGYAPVEKLVQTTESHYSPLAADAFSVGLILLELLLGESLFAETLSAAQQVETFFNLFGTSSMLSYETELRRAGLWPSATVEAKHQRHSLLSFLYRKAPKYNGPLTRLDRETKGLIAGLLELDPRRRLTISEALKHAYFTSRPSPCQPSE